MPRHKIPGQESYKGNQKLLKKFWNGSNKSKLYHEEIKRRLTLGNASYYAVQNYLSSQQQQQPPKNVRSFI
jgi:hypothetical protein